ncbi:MAG: hypothetical protein JXA25_07415 [Anaerolineales bacterium]|nr:hypothetical protein [Anaerolineales bacterium]
MCKQEGYKGGVLIIGSLYWGDKDCRKEWREDHLDMDSMIYVHAPIMYGRLSSSRHNTYTMILSRTCYPDKMGNVILIPLKKPVKDMKDFKNETKALWYAEGGLKDKVRGSWGSVGLLVREDSDFKEKLEEEWKAFYKTLPSINKPSFAKEENGKPIISDDGILNIYWVNTIENGEAVNLDFILATATKPEDELPKSQIIAESMVENCYTRYFCMNRKLGIPHSKTKRYLRYLSIK